MFYGKPLFKDIQVEVHADHIVSSQATYLPDEVELIRVESEGAGNTALWVGSGFLALMGIVGLVAAGRAAAVGAGIEQRLMLLGALGVLLVGAAVLPMLRSGRAYRVYLSAGGHEDLLLTTADRAKADALRCALEEVRDGSAQLAPRAGDR